jgi:hypothetical protein
VVEANSFYPRSQAPAWEREVVDMAMEAELPAEHSQVELGSELIIGASWPTLSSLTSAVFHVGRW